MLKEDEPLGAASVPLSELLMFEGSTAQRSWQGWLPLTWRPGMQRTRARGETLRVRGAE